MHAIKHWTAKRAGGRITVYGKSVTDGSETKIVGVDKIEPRRGGLIVAIDKDGVEHELSPAA